MKRLFLSFLMLCAGFGLLEAAYAPAAGPLQLGGVGGVVTLAGIQRGPIMQALVSNAPGMPNANPKLVAANIAIANFDGQGQNFNPYQTIMYNIGQSTNSQEALAAARAIETVIMHLYDYDNYMLGSYRPGQSVFFTGLRWSWFDPTSYFGLKNWFSDNNARSKQLIDELDNLANIVKIHSISESLRLKATVHSYRHWRRNMAITFLAYLTADMAYHGFDDSVVNDFRHGGFKNSRKMISNHITNICDGACFLGKGVAWGAQGTWSYVLKPVAKAMWGGADAFKEEEKKSEKKDEKIVVSEPKTNEGALALPEILATEIKVPVQQAITVYDQPVLKKSVGTQTDQAELVQSKVDRVQQTEVSSAWNKFLDTFPKQKYQDTLQQKEIARQKFQAQQETMIAKQEEQLKQVAILKAVRDAAKKIELEKESKKINSDTYSYPEVDEEVVASLFRNIWQKGKKIGSAIAEYAAAHDAD